MASRRSAIAVVSLAVLAFAGEARAQAAEKRPAPPPRETCSLDTDCVLTDFQGCCGGCCPRTYATLRSKLRRDQVRCAVIDCERPNCAAMVCEPAVPASQLEARCQGGRCVAVPRAPVQPAECRSDRECTVVYPPPAPNAPCRTSPCGCCPGQEPRAAPVSELEEDATVGVRVPDSDVEPPRPSPPQRRPAPRPGDPAFGLSQGGPLPPPEPPTVQCSPCPAPVPARAVCVQRRCVLATTPRPSPR